MCFIYDKEGCVIPKPSFRVVDEVARQVDPNNVEYIPVENSDDFMEIVVEIAELFPGRAVYDIVRSYFRKVCPLSLIDEETSMLVHMESAVSRYGTGVLPFKPGEIPAGLLEDFNHIATGRNLHERDAEMKRKALDKFNKNK